MSTAERYRAAIEKCERNARLVSPPHMRQIWITMQDSYRLLLQIEQLGIGVANDERPRVQNARF